MKSIILSVLMIVVLAAGSIAAADDSWYVDVDTSLYSARDIEISGANGGFSYVNGTLHYWNSSQGYVTTDVSTGATTVFGLPDGGVNSNGYGDAFGCYDSTSNVFYAATISGMSDAYIYAYDCTANQWLSSGSAVNAYGADCYNGQLYFSGLTETWNGSTGQNNYISRYVVNTPYSESGLGLHDSIIETVGNSASMAIDNQGNFYYATYDGYGSASALYKWDAALVCTVIDDIVNGEDDEYLTLSQGTMLTQLNGGGNGITVDDAGNVFVTINSGSDGSQVIMWNSSMGSGEGYNYDVIATADASMGWGWFGELDIDGNFLAGDSLYGSFGWQNPITEITCTIPEPTTIAIMAIGCMILRMRKKA